MKIKVVNNLEDALKVIEELNKEIDASKTLLTEKETKIGELTKQNSTLSKELEVAKLSLVGGNKQTIQKNSGEDINIADFGINLF